MRNFEYKCKKCGTRIKENIFSSSKKICQCGAVFERIDANSVNSSDFYHDFKY